MVSISLSTGGARLVAEQSGVDDFDNNILIIILIMISIMIRKPGGMCAPPGFLAIYPREHDFVRSNHRNGEKSC